MMELADTSAWVISGRDDELRHEFDGRIESGDLAICDMVKLELLVGARNAREFSEKRLELELLPRCPIRPTEWRRVIDVYEQLARQRGSHQRRVTHPDLVIAAAAEAAGVGLLHYDEDFDAIAAVTGQPTRWIAARGSV